MNTYIEIITVKLMWHWELLMTVLDRPISPHELNKVEGWLTIYNYQNLLFSLTWWDKGNSALTFKDTNFECMFAFFFLQWTEYVIYPGEPEHFQLYMY